MCVGGGKGLPFPAQSGWVSFAYLILFCETRFRKGCWGICFMEKYTGMSTESLPDDEAFLEKFKRQVIEDRTPKPGAANRQAIPTPAAISSHNAANALSSRLMSTSTTSYSRGVRPGGKLPPSGAIVALKTGQVVILDREVEGVPYQLVLSLLQNGSVKSLGINLRQCESFKELGQIGPKDLLDIHIAGAWQHHMIVAYLIDPHDTDYLPNPAMDEAPKRVYEPAVAPAPQPVAAPRPVVSVAAPTVQQAPVFTPAPNPEPAPQPEKQLPPAPFGLKQGQHVQINFGPGRSWDAVYWGESEDKGTLVAHKTHGDWQLAPIDLQRFTEKKVVIGDMMSDRELWEFQEIIKRTYL